MLSIDPVTQKERFSFGLRYSTDAYGKKYIKQFVESGLIQKIIDAQVTRDIRIISTEHLKSFGRDYKLAVGFDQIDMKKGKEIERKSLVAYLSMTAVGSSVREHEKYENPLGIRVTDMAIKFRGTKDSKPNKNGNKKTEGKG